MDVSQMIIGVKLGVQKVDSNAYDTLIPEEIEYYLNKAEREYVRRQNIYLREQLEDMSRHDYITGNEASYSLGSIVNMHTFGNVNISSVSEYDNAKKVSLSQLPHEMFSYVYSQAKPVNGGRWRACKLISSSEIHIYLKSEYSDPIFRRYPVVNVGSDLYIFFDQEGGDVYDYSLLYLKVPDKLVKDSPGSGETTTSELPEHTHDEIIDLAVAMITEDIKSARPYEQSQTTIKGEE